MVRETITDCVLLPISVLYAEILVDFILCMVCNISNLKHHAKLQKNVASLQMGRSFSWRCSEKYQIVFVIYDEIVKIH